MMDKLKFGDFIYKKRKELGLSQEILGYKLGVTNKAVSKWETGETLPDVQLMEHLANVLNVSLDDLYHQDDTPKKEKNKNTFLVVLSIILSVIIVVLSSILLSSYFKENSPTNEETRTLISLDNYDEYISLTPCNKSEMNDQSLTIFGYCNFDNDFIIVENIDVTLEYNLHFYYTNTSNEESMYVFINRQINIEISSNQTFFEIAFSPYNNIEDYKAFKSFDFNCSVKAISGLITSEVSTNEKQ